MTTGSRWRTVVARWLAVAALWPTLGAGPAAAQPADAPGQALETAPPASPSTPPPASQEAAEPGPGSPNDPLEPMNRAIFTVNSVLDEYLVRPLAIGYDRFTPELLRLMVGNFLGNLADPYFGVNNLLQGKPVDAFSDFGRFLVNTTVGFLGIADPATDFGLVKHREDFGQTLAVWGAPSGPFLVLPFFGPSTIRDGLGLGVDLYAGIINRFDNVGFRNTVSGLGVVETRARLLPTDRVLREAFDPYLLVRDTYLQRRRNLIYDGNPPDED